MSPQGRPVTSSIPFPDQGSHSGGRSRSKNDRNAFDIWHAGVSTLTSEQRRYFLQLGRDDIPEYVSHFEEIAKAGSESAPAQRIAHCMPSLLELCKLLAADPLLSHLKPRPSDLILGGICYVLSIKTAFLAIHEKVLNALSSMLQKLPSKERIEAVFRPHGEIQTAAVPICTDILAFCVEVYCLFQDDDGRERSRAQLLLGRWNCFKVETGALKLDVERNPASLDSRDEQPQDMKEDDEADNQREIGQKKELSVERTDQGERSRRLANTLSYFSSIERHALTGSSERNPTRPLECRRIN